MIGNVVRSDRTLGDVGDLPNLTIPEFQLDPNLLLGGLGLLGLAFLFQGVSHGVSRRVDKVRRRVRARQRARKERKIQRLEDRLEKLRK